MRKLIASEAQHQIALVSWSMQYRGTRHKGNGAHPEILLKYVNLWRIGNTKSSARAAGRKRNENMFNTGEMQ